jgi:DNA processing protein
MDNSLPTIAVPGSGLDPGSLHPASHANLAVEITKRGGTLISEFEPDFKATQWSFPMRNRIMAGMSHATLIIEAELKSGTMITAKLTSEYNRELLAVPGSIFSPMSDGPNMFIRLGATPVRSSGDILEALGIGKLDLENEKIKGEKIDENKYQDCGSNEMVLIKILGEGLL